MSLTVDQINNKQFNTKMRGYNPEEVQEFLQEFGILVVDKLDTVLFETAIFFLLGINRGRYKIPYFIGILCHN